MTNALPRLSRRRLLGRLAGAAAFCVGVARFTPALAAATPFSRNQTRRIYLLDPPSGPEGATCIGCKACRNHALHKRFATYEAANTNRAHPHCRCAIRSLTVSHAEFQQLFPAHPETGLVAETIDLRHSSNLEGGSSFSRNSLLGTRHSSLGGLEMPAVGDR